MDQTLHEIAVDTVALVDRLLSDTNNNSTEICVEDCLKKFQYCIDNGLKEDWLYIKYGNLLYSLENPDYQSIIELYQRALEINISDYALIGIIRCYIQTLDIKNYQIYLDNLQRIDPTNTNIKILQDELYNNIVNNIDVCQNSLTLKNINIDYISNNKIKELLIQCLIQNNIYEKNYTIDSGRLYKFKNLHFNISNHNILYCMNKDYIDGFMISLFSFVINNSSIVKHFKFFIAIDHTVLHNQLLLINKLCQYLKIDYKIIIISSETNNQFKTSYGLSDISDRNLNASAYYRIFMLKFIIDNINNDPTLYLDSDTMVLSNISSLFNYYNNDSAIYGCLEDSTNKLVRISKNINGLDYYINSGVLIFNSKHNNSTSCLDKTIRSLNNYNSLIMHDQCAINIGFKNNVGLLPESYNTLLHKYNNLSDVSNISIVHFSGRGKPWHMHYCDHELLSKQWHGYYNSIQYILQNNE